MDLHDEIAKVAYELYLKRGCVDGHDIDDWLEAEWIVLARHAGQEIEEPEEEMLQEERTIEISQSSEIEETVIEETVIEEIEPSLSEVERRIGKKVLRKKGLKEAA